MMIEERESEEQLERRLMREAQDVRMGVLWHPDCKRDGSDSCAKVEVTLGDYVEGTLRLQQWAGHYIVNVPTYEATGEDDYDMDHHPATLAENVAAEVLRKKGHEYRSIDDISAY